MKKVNFNACTFLFLFFISRFLFAQTAKIDSLLSALKMAKNDTAEVNSLMAVSSGYNNLNRYDSALYYGNAALGLSDKSDFHKGIARAYNNLGVIFYSQENYDKALENYQVALNISLEAGDKTTVSNSHNNIGNIYYMQGNYQKALENYFASLEISQELKEIKNASGTYSNIGAIYHEQGDYDKALENFFACLCLLHAGRLALVSLKSLFKAALRFIVNFLLLTFCHIYHFICAFVRLLPLILIKPGNNHVALYSNTSYRCVHWLVNQFHCC